jgi:outer membrane receptor protein involved in Fe transport
MQLKYYVALSMALWNVDVFAQNTEKDTLTNIHLTEVVVSSTKETNDLKTLPGAISVLSSRQLDERKIASLTDLSTIIPNVFVPNYGSKMSPPVYIRGIGERSTGQAVGLYVDNMPYLDKSVFNFEFLDVQRIEVLRGPQGTLYGRNAMGGIINIYTKSPLDEEPLKASISAGNYGYMRGNLSAGLKLGKRAGVIASVYGNKNNGFFENQYDGKQADKQQSLGTRLRLDIKPSENWLVQWMANTDYAKQGAFPYGLVTNDGIEQPNYDTPGTYLRNVLGTNLNVTYKNDKIIASSSTGLQYFDDDMNMDLDYTPLSYFTLNQKQKETNLIQEFTVKSNTKGHLKWVVGAFGFHRNLTTDVTTTMGKSGIDSILQPVFSALITSPFAPRLVVANDEIPMPGLFKTPTYGGAVFYESTINNLLFKGFAFTMGSRLDYEKSEIAYNTSMATQIDAVMGGNVMQSEQAGTTLTGKGSKNHLTYLPKFAVKYEFNEKNYIYATAARGYKTGGYNIQMFSDIVQDVVSEKHKRPRAEWSNPFPGESQDSILPLISYDPEFSWNYELGFKGEILKNKLFVEAAVFYVNVTDVQITQFVQSGQGRMLKNAGHAQSTGFDLELRAYPIDGLALSASYGYAHAVLKDYKTATIDYSGNFIPFAPQNTFSLGASYSKGISNSKIIDRWSVQAQYNGAGKIYWTEANDTWQDMYGLLNLKAGVGKGAFALNVWTRNTLNADYAAFSFESTVQNSLQTFAQKGAPFQVGVDLTVSF